MRRRLVVVGLAVTLLTVIALIVPLGLLVRRQASDRARVAAERQAQSAAALVAFAVTVESGPEALESLVDGLDAGVIVVLPDETISGEPFPGQGSLVDTARAEQATISAVVDGGWELALPVIGAGGIAVVDAFATDAQLTEGVVQAWGLLAVLGIFLIGISVWVADRLGRRMVVPMRELAGAAHLLGEGDLEVRVDTHAMGDVPDEIVEIGEAFNTLASRLDQLLLDEREASADLSHQLRTPLTSLRLQAEKISDAGDRQETLSQVERLEEATDRLIEVSRSQRPGHPGTCRLDEIASERASFWGVLAEEENRDFSVSLGVGSAELGVSAEEIGIVIDSLIGNVFAHTPPGTPFGLETGLTDNRFWIELADAGPGLPELPVLDRGASGRGSTGLGLDIVRRTAEKTGGSIELRDSNDVGAVVRVWFG